jgi:Ni,Fe-hydrogenase III large subunit
MMYRLVETVRVFVSHEHAITVCESAEEALSVLVGLLVETVRVLIEVLRLL